MCGEKLAPDIHRLTQQCEANLDNYAKEVSRTKHLMKIFKPKQKDRLEDLKNFTKAQLTKKQNNMKWRRHHKRIGKKGKKYGMIEFLKKLENE